MTTIKAILNHRPDKHGRHKLVLQIIHRRRRGVIFTQYGLRSAEFDSVRGVAVARDRTKDTRSRTREINEYIYAQTVELRRIVTELEERGHPFSPTDITAAYRRRSDQCFVRTFTLSLIGELDRQGKHGTMRTYRAALSAFEKFRGHSNTRFVEIDATLAAGFEGYMKSIPLQQNTVTFYMRCLRAIYNKAKRAGLTGAPCNPFEGISFRIETTQKLALGHSVLRRVAEANLSTDRPLDEARDLFMFLFYARGMSFVDVAFLRRDMFREGVIHYKRQKTGQQFSVRITPPLQALIDKYADRCGEWVMPVMHGGSLAWDTQPQIAGVGARPPATAEDKRLLYKKYLLSLSRYLECLEELSAILNTGSKLKFNVARHSWASLARTKGIPVAVISEGLGHTSEKTTLIYLDQLDARTVDNANEVVISTLKRPGRIMRLFAGAISVAPKRFLLYLHSASSILFQKDFLLLQRTRISRTKW